MVSLSSDSLYLQGNSQQIAWNKKLCFEARDTLYDCVDATPNGNKLRCPDQLYAYEMWCPAEFRRMQSANFQKQALDQAQYDADWVNKVNRAKQTITNGHMNPQ